MASTAAFLLLPTLDGCSPASAVFKTKISKDLLITVPANQVKETSLNIIRPEGWQYDIALHKNEDGSYSALLLRCTHMDNQLSQASGGYICHLHGSRFNINGKVTKGPAERSLESFPVSKDAFGNILIDVKNV